MSSAVGEKFAGGASGLLERLADLADGRIAAMDAAGVDVAVLSLTSPGLEQSTAAEAVPLARETNDQLAAAARNTAPLKDLNTTIEHATLIIAGLKRGRERLGG